MLLEKGIAALVEMTVFGSGAIGTVGGSLLGLQSGELVSSDLTTTSTPGDDGASERGERLGEDGGLQWAATITTE